ncbi:hypothetical protein FH161_00225 [Staphylococcus lugdunensis]|uniref:hypothetical protein n=1 Tax=Staphylococcus lugdunensis TaxID=28035 RepID=UPI001F55AD8E|nr:hypothetical protein [Staphylococcus lugdunensis]MCI2750589.1 hypothetical protein [Staphylococcus lugdunensis]MCI2753644.1 hypothetical protein [Staphylococcus lugdunensis]MCI2756631.1 hypothetical protein [Staphylococcus lugdunensis]MCI2782159.1 hypothetical protein [Staphylococcus lugdunensis]MCI2797526.1 hypothetical protein [Staphylococcus lugdunensis]
MVKIKREVEMTLPELIEWGWKNKIRNKDYRCNELENQSVTFNDDGAIEINYAASYLPYETYTVVVEEEITEDTEFYPLVLLNGRNIFYVWRGMSIKQLKSDNTKAFYILNDDMTMTLIWKNGELV